jgi:hypothetical protein
MTSIMCSGQVVQPGPAAGDGGEGLRDLRRPGHDLKEHLRQVDARQHGRRPGAQVDKGRRLLDSLDPGEVDLPLGVDADLGAGGQPPADFPVGGVQRPGVPGQQRVRGAGSSRVVSTSPRIAAHASPSRSRACGLRHLVDASA